MGLSPFCVLSEGEENEGAGVPYGMGDDEGREALREESIDEAPAAATTPAATISRKLSEGRWTSV